MGSRSRSLSKGNAHREDGFSLLEVLITLGILSLAVGVVGLAAVPMIERREARADRQEVLQIFREARYRAMLDNRKVGFRDFSALKFDDASRVTSDIVIYSSGICIGNTARLIMDHSTVVIRLLPNSCELRFV